MKLDSRNLVKHDRVSFLKDYGMGKTNPTFYKITSEPNMHEKIGQTILSKY